MIVQTMVGQEIETPINKKLARAPLCYFNLLAIFKNEQLLLTLAFPR